MSSTHNQRNRSPNSHHPRNHSDSNRGETTPSTRISFTVTRAAAPSPEPMSMRPKSNGKRQVDSIYCTFRLLSQWRCANAIVHQYFITTNNQPVSVDHTVATVSHRLRIEKEGSLGHPLTNEAPPLYEVNSEDEVSDSRTGEIIKDCFALSTFFH